MTGLFDFDSKFESVTDSVSKKKRELRPTREFCVGWLSANVHLDQAAHVALLPV